jgi:hypothetical protein
MSGIEAIVGFVALGIAIPGVVETFVHVAAYLSKKVRTSPNKTAKERIKSFTNSIERGAIRSSLETAEDLFCDTNDDILRKSIAEYIELLRCQLPSLDRALEEMTEGKSEKSENKWAKEALSTIENLERTGTRFQSFLNTKIAGRVLPSKLELRSNQFQIIGTPSVAHTKLPLSEVNIIKADFSGSNNRWGSTQNCILEERTFPGHHSEAAYARAKELGRLLEFTKFSEGLLEFAGFRVIHTSPLLDDRFQLIFTFPDTAANPRSLRGILLDPINSPRPPIPRNFRFVLPRKLAEAVYHVHRHNLVHKSIRPETILIFELQLENGTRGDSYPTAIGAPYLTDWKYTRKTVEASSRNPDPGEWATALYQHPERRVAPGLVAESKYNIGHDIYSLGICLLEIGLWTSFLVYDNNVPSLSPLIQEQTAIWRSQNTSPADLLLSDAKVEQKALLMLAGDALAFEMGQAYSDMVIKCLSCLEKGFGNVRTFVNSESKDWEDEGVSFIQEIRKELSGASTM